MNCGIISAARRRSAGGGSFSNVKLLMGFEGTNGSTSFVDESASPHTMTANGNVQITTSQSKFGSSSAAFDGSGDFISTPASADWDFGSGQFTVEGFFRFLVKQNSQALLGQWDNAGTFTNDAWYVWIDGGNLKFTFAHGGALTNVQTAFVPTLGQWYHVAVDRDASDKFRLYLDGAMIASSTASGVAITTSTGSLVLGRIGTGTTFSSYDFNGDMDEIRITKGVARYASDSGFTVPTAAYPRS